LEFSLFGLVALSSPPLSVLLGFEAGRLALRYEVPVGFYFAQDAAYLHRLLKAV
jgi:hypothetical protein